MMEAIERVKRYLDNLPFPVQVIEFAANTHTAELAAEAVGVEVGQIAKTLLFVGKEAGQAVLVVTSGDKKVDAKKLKKQVGYKAKFADNEQVQALTGFKPGGVCPFALPQEIPVLLDTSMERFPIVYAAAGSPHSAVPVTLEQLQQITKGEMCDLA